MSRYALIALAVISSGCLSSSISRREVLAREAPETLVAPRRADFASDDCYRRALDLFVKRGDWATEGDDGVKLCKM